MVSARRGEIANKHKQVLVESMACATSICTNRARSGFAIRLRAKMLVLDKVYPEGIRIPKRLVGSNIIHLPTMKTHVFTG